jgi:hypothetical protein
MSGIVSIPESTVGTRLQQTEIDASDAGSSIEVSRNIAVLSSQTQAETDGAVTADRNDKYNFTYKFYGVTLDATA